MTLRAIVLAAGKGTRMKSGISKVLHELCGRPMLWYVLQSLREAGIDDVVVVTNDDLEPHVARFGVRSVVQREQLGTGHAVKVALESLERREDGRVVVAYGDMPLVTTRIFRAMVDSLESGSRACGDVARDRKDAAAFEFRPHRARRRGGAADRRSSRRDRGRTCDRGDERGHLRVR